MIATLLVLISLYRHQKKKDHGFPVRANRNCGSKLSRFLPNDKSNIAAGFPNEKEGINEIPLFVTVTAPPKCPVILVLS
jgi:hypothetical protein